LLYFVSVRWVIIAYRDKKVVGVFVRFRALHFEVGHVGQNRTAQMSPAHVELVGRAGVACHARLLLIVLGAGFRGVPRAGCPTCCRRVAGAGTVRDCHGAGVRSQVAGGTTASSSDWDVVRSGRCRRCLGQNHLKQHLVDIEWRAPKDRSCPRSRRCS
jgi:hypothetical protein